ncbi:MAG: DUF448 domain-containing protein [Candidatus Cloacimonetes bacterium]|nr:DUF448 domain-containing protein [Candidatus Cloacimonadota bacterium]
MPNRSSNTGHIPQRSCVICRKKIKKKELLRFVILENEIIFDQKMNLQKRGYYCCDDNLCLKKLVKWKSKVKS